MKSRRVRSASSSPLARYVVDPLERRLLLCETHHLEGVVETKLTGGSDHFYSAVEMPASQVKSALAYASRQAKARVSPAVAESGLEPLDSIKALPNLHMIDAYMTDANGNLVSTPAVGSYAYMQIEYSTVGLASGATYTVRMAVGGQNIDYPVDWGAGGAGTQYWILRLGVWLITPGFKSATATLDVNNDIIESDGTDNTGSAGFTPAVMSPKFVMPLEGTPWKDWTIVNYVDLDLNSPGTGDYNGGTWTYDGHNGWDMVSANWRQPDAYPGVDVYAAAAGTVVASVDGNFDRVQSWTNPPAANYITIDHGNGFSTTYYHLRRDSLLVQNGDTVVAGQKIAEMASSGRSTNPHLHWGVYYKGMLVEPGVGMSQYMATPLAYADQNPAIINAGSGIISYAPSGQMYDGPVTIDNFNPGDTVYFWGVLGGTQPGDSFQVKWYNPSNVLQSTSSWNEAGQQYRYYWPSFAIPGGAPTGTWHADWYINGVLNSSKSFTVQNSMLPAEVRMTDSGGNYIIDNRSTPFSLGSVLQGSTAGLPVFSFIVNNDGGSDLTTSGLSVPAGFSVVNGLAGIIPAGSSEVVSLRLDADYDGYKGGWVSFNTNDADFDEGFMRFRIEGTVNPLASVTGGSGIDTVYIKKNGSDSRIWINTSTANPPTYELPTTELSGITFNTGAGNDSMTVDYTAGDPLGGNITFSASSATDTLAIIGDAASTTYLAGPAGIAVIGGDTISFSSLEDLIVNGGNGDDVLSLNFLGFGDDLDNIGYDTDFNGDGGTDSVSVNDLADVGARTYDIDYGTVGRSGWSHSVSYAGDEALTLNANNSGDTINLNNGAFATQADITINAGDGWDIVNVGATSVSPIDGAVVVNGDDGLDFININDQATITADAWNIAFNSATRPGFGGLTYTTAEGLVLNAQDVASTINVNSSAQNTPLAIHANGGADTINVLGNYLGTEVIVNSGAGDDALNVNLDNAGQSRVRLLGSETLGSVNVGSGGGIRMDANGASVLLTQTLAVNAAGFIDLADNSMVVDYAGASPLPAVRGLIASGFAGGAWTGNGIRSSSAAAQTTRGLGYAEASALLGPGGGSFAGISVDGTAVLIKYTWFGDTNLDGQVDVIDLGNLATAWQTSGSWINGDSNYDGLVDVIDLGMLATNWQAGV